MEGALAMLLVNAYLDNVYSGDGTQDSSEKQLKEEFVLYAKESTLGKWRAGIFDEAVTLV